MTTTNDPHIATLREERDWYAVAIANDVADGRSPSADHVARFRTAERALHRALGLNVGD